MADHDVLLGDDALRLLDVLLEEEAAATTAIAPSPFPLPVITRVRPQNWQWLAAALLGIAVVIATSWLTHAPTRAPTAPIQDPAPKAAEVVPFDVSSLPDVVLVRMRMREGGPYYGSAIDSSDFIEIRDPTELAAWRETFNKAPETPMYHNHVIAIELCLSRGRVMEGLGNFGFVTFGGNTFLSTPPFAVAFRKSVDELRRKGRRARAIAANLDELRELDPSSRAIVSPWLTAAEARAELRRFPRLESIEFAPGACSTRAGDVVEIRSLPDKDLALGLAEITTLQHLALLGSDLHADALRALATLPNLRSLVIPSGLGDVPAVELGALASRLEVLHARGSLMSDEQLLAIRRSTTLKELWVRCGMTSQSLADCLLALPSLRRLSVLGYRHDCSSILGAIARTRVAELHLEEVQLASDAFTTLADLPSLHTLHLVNVTTAVSEIPDCESLQQLRHLAVGWAPRHWLERTRAALPNCSVHPLEPGDPWVSPFYPPRR